MGSFSTYKSHSLKRSIDDVCLLTLCTRPQHDKEVCRKLQKQQLTASLPIQKTFRRWSDRKKKVIVPLFNYHIFVYTTAREYYEIMNIPEVVCFIIFEGKAVAIPEKQIGIVKNLLKHDMKVEEVQDIYYAGANVIKNNRSYKLKFGQIN